MVKKDKQHCYGQRGCIFFLTDSSLTSRECWKTRKRFLALFSPLPSLNVTKSLRWLLATFIPRRYRQKEQRTAETLCYKSKGNNAQKRWRDHQAHVCAQQAAFQVFRHQGRGFDGVFGGCRPPADGSGKGLSTREVHCPAYFPSFHFSAGRYKNCMEICNYKLWFRAGYKLKKN